MKIHSRNSDMVHSRLSQRGQTTIPQSVREALSLSPGDRIEYEMRGDGVVIRRDPGPESLRGFMRDKIRRPPAPAEAEREGAWKARSKQIARGNARPK